uniref:RPAP3_C domain-containing protein n=1 Tax=Macrostomum lignano TaxID=282301 RepID=A0A1I8GMG3_9PLAT
MDPMTAQFTRRYNIPLDHLDFRYISGCSDVKELENIYKVLLSGEEGRYPELETHCEERLRLLAPNSRALRKEQPPLSAAGLDQAEWASIAADLNAWTAAVNTNTGSADAGQEKSKTDADDLLPPVRAANATINLSQSQQQQQMASSTTTTSGRTSGSSVSASSAKRPMPRSYDEWSKLEKQLEAQEERDAAIAADEASIKQANASKPSPAATASPASRKVPNLPNRLRVDGLSNEERARLAEQEKAKGNEAFRSGDYEEAALYYSRSVSASPLPAAYNNRAFAYLKLQKYTACVKDCGRVLKAEPDNVKALLRRATAYQKIHRIVDARADLERLLRLDPGSAAGSALLSELDAELAKRGKTSASAKRMVIEEVGSSEEDDEDDNNAGLEANGPVSNALNGRHQAAAGGSCSTVQSSNSQVETEQASPPVMKDPFNSSTVEQPQQQEKAAEAANSTNKEKSKKKSGKKSSNKKAAAAQDEAAPAQPPADEFDAAKEAGNQLFKAGNYARAVKLYDKCSELRPNDPVSYTNRAVCYIKLDQPNDAVYECNMALELEPNNMKAIFRRGVARKMLGFYRESLLDFNLAKSFDPLNKQIAKEIAEVESAMRKSAGRRVLVEEVEDEDDDEEEAGQDAADVAVVREVDGVVTESRLTAAGAREATPEISTTATDKSTVDSNNSTLVADVSAAEKSTPESNKSTPAADNSAAVLAKSTNETTTTSAAIKSTAESNKSAPVADKSTTEPVKSTSATKTSVSSTDKTTVASPRLQFPEPVGDKPSASVRPDCSPFEFTQAWLSAARSSSPSQPASAIHADMLTAIECSRLPRLLSNKLDGLMLAQIVAAVRDRLAERDARAGANVLLSLPGAERFDFVVMFLDAKEKA